jgi:hypothetical protein
VECGCGCGCGGVAWIRLVACCALRFVSFFISRGFGFVATDARYIRYASDSSRLCTTCVLCGKKSLSNLNGPPSCYMPPYMPLLVSCCRAYQRLAILPSRSTFPSNALHSELLPDSRTVKDKSALCSRFKPQPMPRPLSELRSSSLRSSRPASPSSRPGNYRCHS